jgi:hypothetical protein
MIKIRLGLSPIGNLVSLDSHRDMIEGIDCISSILAGHDKSHLDLLRETKLGIIGSVAILIFLKRFQKGSG